MSRSILIQGYRQDERGRRRQKEELMQEKSNTPLFDLKTFMKDMHIFSGTKLSDQDLENHFTDWTGKDEQTSLPLA